MRVVVQRVINSSVEVDGKIVGKSDKGLMLLVGFTEGDSSKEIDWMVEKVINLRIFEDENEKMNLSLKDVGGELLVVSQFTLYGDCRKGRRPSFSSAARPEVATKLYEEFIEKARKEGIVTKTGQFGAHMMVDLTNDGPVTILLESNRDF